MVEGLRGRVEVVRIGHEGGSAKQEEAPCPASITAEPFQRIFASSATRVDRPSLWVTWTLLNVVRSNKNARTDGSERLH